MVQLEIWLRKVMIDFNRGLKKGVAYPYAFNEFDTKVYFNPHSAHFILKNRYEDSD